MVRPASQGENSTVTAPALSLAAKSLFVGGPYLQRKLQHYRPFICPFERVLAHVPESSTVFDVGCGGGLFLGLLAHQGRVREGLGIDIFEPAVATARDMATRLPADRGTLAFHRRPPEDLWPGGTFEVVSMIDVLHHVPPGAQQEFVRRAIAHVAPGGLFVYKDMCDRPLWRAWMNRLHDLTLAKQWIHYVPVESIEAWAREAGLSLVASEWAARLWYGHELRVFRRPAP